jgi:5-methyltetrahydropteroyltriglutamate--homocysteine methyltransferase
VAVLFPVTTVGSWSRSPELLDALRKRQAGQLSEDDFQERADQAVLECLRLQDEAGVDIVTDGEQRRDNFYSFVVDKLDGARLMSMRDLLDYMPDPAFFEKVMKNSDVVPEEINNAIVVDKLSLKGPGLAVDEAAFLREHTDKPIKVALPGPYHLTRSGWSQALSQEAYPSREDLAEDVVALLRHEVETLRDAGVAFVQFDEPSLSEIVYSAETEGTFY